ncbi:SDR family oxidoreductase [Leptospira bourretii]|uniref:SDR family oxidoreductase n=1 Tax=Leptospira bourretii TaxID=2484962 RepID=A0A4R9IKW4_9LEPT|nr:SDR family oxidoreductase [Leptospira bourretii]TGK79544.1 SDR family oxidoreductase [Leptospira bourretii]TGK89752.1 SDR family oxidoreductase [Leptospira bourretii]TGL19485.1 SDR family oxidoreductase [Leptospira bourretii]TGL35961.1 SDR family oxidoreductase [Leptospira bourretii]
MNTGLKDKKVLVTGSTKGIGFQTALSFTKEGAEVFLHGRSEEDVKVAISKIKAIVPNAKLGGVSADLAIEEGIQKLTKEIPELDVLVNNAGYFEPKPFFEIKREDWKRMYETNVLSGAELTQYYLKGMIQRNYGRIVFVSSESALNIPVEMVHYGMSKTAQLSIARGSAEVCKGTSVTVNSVLPGPTLSEGVEDFIESLAKEKGKSKEEMAKDFIRENRPSSLVGRFAKPEEIANVILFLTSELASMINGASVRADGGVYKSI